MPMFVRRRRRRLRRRPLLSHKCAPNKNSFGKYVELSRTSKMNECKCLSKRRPNNNNKFYCIKFQFDILFQSHSHWNTNCKKEEIKAHNGGSNSRQQSYGSNKWMNAETKAQEMNYKFTLNKLHSSDKRGWWANGRLWCDVCILFYENVVENNDASDVKCGAFIGTKERVSPCAMAQSKDQ